MVDRTSLPEYVIAFSHRATEGAGAHCDRTDYDTFYRVVTDLEKDKFNNRIKIKVVDWEEETSTIENLDNAARKSNALLFLIEGKPGEKQLNGYKDYKSLEQKPSLLILDKQLPYWSEQDIKSHEDELIKCFEDKFIPFRDFDQLYGLLSRKLHKLIKEWADSNSISLDVNSANPTKPKWWLWLALGALIIGLLLLFFGNRRPKDIPGGQLPGDNISTVVTPDSTGQAGQDPVPAPGDSTPDDSTPGKQGPYKLPGSGGGSVAPSSIIEDGTFDFENVPDSLRGYISKTIQGLKRPAGGNKERWTIFVEIKSSSEIPKLDPTDAYKVEVKYYYRIKDNQTNRIVSERTEIVRGSNPFYLKDAIEDSRSNIASIIANDLKQQVQ